VTTSTDSYLRGPAFARLWQAARDAYERNGGLAGQAILRGLTGEEAAELNGLLRRRTPLRAGRQLKLDLTRLDEALRDFACPLEEWLVAVGGKLANRPAQREQAGQREAAVWAELEGRATAVDERLNAVVEDLRRSGMLKRLARGAELELGREAMSVLARLLEAAGETVDIAVLAAGLCGDSKALNDGRPLTTVVLRALALLAEEQAPANAEARRELWERYGVVCDPLSSHVLFLNLPVVAEPGVAAAVGAHRVAGEPMRLTLRALRRFPLRFEAGATIYICENPTVVSAAAEAHGERCSPLVCTDGRPVVAVRRLLEQAAAQGCALRYHGDFDWPGVGMAADAISRYGATPWKLGAGDYRRAVEMGAPAKELKGRSRSTRWDPELAAEMSRAGLMVEEEAVITDLLTDLGVTAVA
jgi:uncharacterized protein (TIGR02679 family)